ncbi:5'-nucleotidase /3'-nucleotidase /exopolyphosphatase [Tindallia magadiensis]|uniref:5'-nucleotidase SurE n=1 Tax=Tindallia magadiensis TaxID=69895 RepID=A0A1I3AI72_9FIRM|nr:5'/3'-nucleotidase SurE [Tindallia magadiensis]SFH49041.1 5'-nucleotidase /3'-nucleotidase /exopolyphosphatase [Tindallia magadiensis]
MHILLTNDDGIHAPGIKALVKSMKSIGEVTVVAPDNEKSAIGHAITIHSPITVKHTRLIDDEVNAYAVHGTPADCIKLAVEVLLSKNLPDIIISGINSGPNLGTDVIYSGTVSGALEGSMMGFPSIAISMSRSQFESYDHAALFVSKIASRVLDCSKISPIAFNINYPVCDEKEVKGTKVTKLGVRKYRNNFIRRKDPRGNWYYWMNGEPENLTQDENSDITAVSNNYISVTPLHFDLTSYDILDKIKWLENENMEY